MADKEMLFVYNPRAGKAKIKNKLQDIIEVFVKGGYEVTVYPTQHEGDAIGVVQNKKDRYDIVVCCGGDGTLDEVVNGMVLCEKKVPIGYIPAGSTNDFASSLGIPKDMVKAARLIVEGKDYACDIGAFNKECFVYIAAFGIFTEVSYETSQDIKNVLGHMAYILEGMKRIPNIRSYRLKIRHGDTVIEDEFIFGMVTNSTSVGGFKRITGKYVELNDGEFEVTLIKMPKNPLELNNTLTALLSRNIHADYMYCFKTSQVTFESDDEIAWTLDGEFGGNHKEVNINNMKQAVKIRIPYK
ncbi:diacylglycerol/lipid kinase family protein [Kineothrix sp. MB12-C1]|uniref:diacylglycerol/lipid kinase family protein n=1 Tax=Kineothrix sp. MB12-C1 TaxID=3070215 RepID=UPI0027D2A5DE|nr:YegS/Rv2252/BmrU family lipid kinase [Kineothrix sp. MB12-C1]WMC91508.1 YegS/Rv2252/BmrU family lipid kinase [Kineothrix sp. MB12-C1]